MTNPLSREFVRGSFEMEGDYSDADFASRLVKETQASLRLEDAELAYVLSRRLGRPFTETDVRFWRIGRRVIPGDALVALMDLSGYPIATPSEEMKRRAVISEMIDILEDPARMARRIREWRLVRRLGEGIGVVIASLGALLATRSRIAHAALLTAAVGAAIVAFGVNPTQTALVPPVPTPAPTNPANPAPTAPSPSPTPNVAAPRPARPATSTGGVVVAPTGQPSHHVSGRPPRPSPPAPTPVPAPPSPSSTPGPSATPGPTPTCAPLLAVNVTVDPVASLGVAVLPC